MSEVCTPARFELAIEEVLNDAAGIDNPLVDMLTPFLKDNEDHLADLFSRTALKFLLGDQKKMMGSVDSTIEGDGPRPASRRIVRVRMVRHLIRDKGMSRKAAKSKVDELTDTQIDAAVGALPAQGVGDWLAAVVEFIKNNWATILKVLLSLLVFII